MFRKSVAATLFFTAWIASTPAKAIIIAEYGAYRVNDSVTQLDASTWKYDFSITNTSYRIPGFGSASDLTIIGYKVPYFSDAGITSIQAPTGWSYSIINSDTFSLGNGAQTLKWTASSVDYGIADTNETFFTTPADGETLGGFSYIASYGPVNSPVSTVILNRFGSANADPAIPHSPLAQAAGLNDPYILPSQVPEPATTALLGLGLLGVAASHRKAAKK